MFSQHRLGVRSRPCIATGDFPAAGTATVGHHDAPVPRRGSGSVVLSYVAAAPSFITFCPTLTET